MLDYDKDQALVLGILSQKGPVSSRDLQAATGKSQATVSRVLAELSNRVLVLGKARSTRYGLPKSIRGGGAQQPIWWTRSDGTSYQFGTLSLLAGNAIFIESDHIQTVTAGELPWFLTPLRAQGFLGRIHAERLAVAQLDSNPDRWRIEDVLYSALHLHDAPGAMTIGQFGGHPRHGTRLPSSAVAMGHALDALAFDVAKMLPAGSSAGGEQPKFLATLDSGEHVLVKFTPPRGTPFGERWHDLLHAESLSGKVLAAGGVDVADSRIVESTSRTYLVSTRFDRVGEFGRRHIVALGDAHRAFVPDSYRNWAESAAALARQGRLSEMEAQQAAALLGFGRLIGNSDMHSGNLGLIVELDDISRGRFRLAPVYDMLPMRWRPQPAMGTSDYEPFHIEMDGITGPSVTPARAFWTALAENHSVSRELRAVALTMDARIGELVGSPAFSVRAPGAPGLDTPKPPSNPRRRRP